VSANSDILFGNHLVFCLGASARTRGGVYHVWSEHVVLHVQTGRKNSLRCPGTVITTCSSLTIFRHLKLPLPLFLRREYTTFLQNNVFTHVQLTVILSVVVLQFCCGSHNNSFFLKSLHSHAVPSTTELAC